MNFGTKRRIVLVGLVVLTVWPPVHHLLVRALDLSAWKGFGWSMYCVPPRVVNTYLTSLDDGRQLTGRGLDPQRRQELFRAGGEFGKWRAEFGRWVEPDEFARVVLRCYPSVQRVEVAVEQVAVDRSSAIYERQRVDRYEYRRSEFE